MNRRSSTALSNLAGNRRQLCRIEGFSSHGIYYFLNDLKYFQNLFFRYTYCASLCFEYRFI